MDVMKISFYSTNQNPVALYHILDDPSVKLTLFQPPTVVESRHGYLDRYGACRDYILPRVLN
jgi:hypothetical protein